MKNVTISLDEETAHWVRRFAAERDMSVSRLVGELLAERMRQLDDYERAMRAFFSKRPVKLSNAGDKYPSRDDLHDRARLR